MSDTTKHDPSIPGPATKPVEETTQTPPAGRHSADAAATAATPGQPMPAEDAQAQERLDDQPPTQESLGSQQPITDDDPWTRPENSAEPLGLNGETEFWDTPEEDEREEESSDR
ncbi:hypothetical protein [Roseisalinus antarcticus]|uniref:Uncharacterized protein n=1 Tax=Roseisalinus antarcticus TaxID=254357 RepID=A0A1Y5TWS3_9RHOB|nr:hypothetical protein [Roseisalinus antarcticus]SLN75614.1 hypothetical protein ROA7023_04000 [Roseisalinus antarcticus]